MAAAHALKMAASWDQQETAAQALKSVAALGSTQALRTAAAQALNMAATWEHLRTVEQELYQFNRWLW